MALGTIDQDTKRKIYLSISHGKVVHYLSGGNVENFKNVGGRLQDITIKERTFNGVKTPFWYMDIKDRGELYSISLPYASGTFKSIILALASYQSLSKETNILIEPYEKGNYTKVAVYADEKKLDWVVKELPPLKEVVVGGKKYSDDTERMEFIKRLASQVKERIGKGSLT
jgi:hypothetical protein